MHEVGVTMGAPLFHLKKTILVCIYSDYAAIRQLDSRRPNKELQAYSLLRVQALTD